MIRIRYRGNDKKLQLAVGCVNDLFLDLRFYHFIQNHGGFDMADINSSRLSDLIRGTRLDMEVDLYYSMSPFCKSLTYDDPEHPHKIWLNKWNLDRSIDSICNTFVHQCIHAVNAKNPQYYFGHGDSNESSGKENTAPYWIASLAQRLILKDDTRHEEGHHAGDFPVPVVNTGIIRKKTLTMPEAGYCH